MTPARGLSHDDAPRSVAGPRPTGRDRDRAGDDPADAPRERPAPMTTDFTNLAPDITPGEFFQAVQDALASEPAPANASPDKLVIHVDGEAGGTWSMGFSGGKLAIEQAATAGAPLQVSMSTPDLRSFIAGDIRDAIKAKAGGRGQIDAKQIGKLYKITHKTEQVKAFSGDLQLRMEDAGKGKTYKLTLTFGGGAPNVAAPKTTISMALNDFLGLIGGELNPQAAFFAGQIRLDGDMNLAMGLMALAM